MRRRGLVPSLMILSQLSTAGYLATAQVEGSGHFDTAFEQLKGLVGTWQGQGPHGWAKFTYHLTGMGSALVETDYEEGFADGAEAGMSTVYHMDGDELMLTHYCGASNQPRMKAVSFDQGRGLVRFEFQDITNLSAPSAYFTREVEIEILDDKHLQVRFNGSGEGKEYPATYDLVRLDESN